MNEMILYHLVPIKRKDFDEKMFGKKKQKKEIVMGYLVCGIPEHENSDLFISLENDQIVISSHIDFKNKYTIALDKVTAISTYTEMEVEKIISQSAPGMIVGAATFGVLGAMIGGRVKTKEKKTVNNFLLIKHGDASEFVMRTTYIPSVSSFIEKIHEIKPELNQPQTIEL